MAIKKVLGPVSAYALAVKQGYTGTEEEWATLQAESGNNAQRAKDEADRAQQIVDNIIDPTLTVSGKAPDSKVVGDALEDLRRQIPVYGVCWDKVNAKMTRTKGAASITTDTTNFAYKGEGAAKIQNPFDGIYPWSERKLCNINIETYRTLVAGESLTACIKAWEDEPTFSYDDEDGVWVYTPEFWGRTYEKGGCRYFEVSGTSQPEFIHYKESIEGRWCGTISQRTIDGTSKKVLIPKPGVPARNEAVRYMHTYAKNYGGTVENIFSVDRDTLLYVVEFANMNSQQALGDGVSNLYRQSEDKVKETASNTSTIKIARNTATYCEPGALVDLGTTNGGSQVGTCIVSGVENDPSSETLSIVSLTSADGVAPASVSVEAETTFWSIHGLSNTKSEEIGSGSGYVGTNSRSHAFYRGAVFHANQYFYVLGAYREQGTGNIWIAHNEREADGYDELDKSVHLNTGMHLPDKEAEANGGYVGDLHLPTKGQGLTIPPFTAVLGGSSANPVGDYTYLPARTSGNTILLLSGYAALGGYAGRFSGSWLSSSWHSSWRYSARPLLLTPEGV